jgi:hypothetical protein
MCVREWVCGGIEGVINKNKRKTAYVAVTIV